MFAHIIYFYTRFPVSDGVQSGDGSKTTSRKFNFVIERVRVWGSNSDKHGFYSVRLRYFRGVIITTTVGKGNFVNYYFHFAFTCSMSNSFSINSLIIDFQQIRTHFVDTYIGRYGYQLQRHGLSHTFFLLRQYNIIMCDINMPSTRVSYLRVYHHDHVSC